MGRDLWGQRRAAKPGSSRGAFKAGSWERVERAGAPQPQKDPRGRRFSKLTLRDRREARGQGAALVTPARQTAEEGLGPGFQDGPACTGLEEQVDGAGARGTGRGGLASAWLCLQVPPDHTAPQGPQEHLDPR